MKCQSFIPENNVTFVQNPVTSALSVASECFNTTQNFSRTSSPASSSINFSFDGQDVNISEIHKDDGRTSVSSFSNNTSMLALPSSLWISDIFTSCPSNTKLCLTGGES